MQTATVLGQPSIRIASDTTEAWVAITGGQIAPVVFRLPAGPVEPFSVAPWAEEDLDLPPILKALRGDFFCMPFGANQEPFDGERHPMHGETANADWTVETHTNASVKLSLETAMRKAWVKKLVEVRAGQTALYQRNTVIGAEGPICFGHHAMLKFRSKGFVSVAPFGFGQVYPGEFEAPAQGGYSSLKRGARFDSLDRVPSNDGAYADLSAYPAREGFEDLVMVYAAHGSSLGWSAVHFPEEGYVWFALKDPKVLTGTVVWHSNGGRHYAPWSGRHRGVLGIEEVTSSFHFGLAGSVAESEASREGYRTFAVLDPSIPLVVNTIMGVAASGGLNGPIADIVADARGIRILDNNRAEISVPLDVNFLQAHE